MNRIAHIRIRPAHREVAHEVREQFVSAWKQGRYAGEYFDFESPAALFRLLTPKRWDLLTVLQGQGPLGVRALARALDRDVRRVHDDARALLEVGLVEKDEASKLLVPFAEIHADFVLRAA